MNEKSDRPGNLPQPGDQLEDLCGRAKTEVLLAAPFIKAGPLERLVQRIAEGVPLTVITRWRVEEVAAGVSDLEVWPLLQSRPGSLLFLRPDLHAKYYRGDQYCLVGSANVTAAALDWIKPANLELLVELPSSAQHLAAFEQSLRAQCILVTEDLFDEITALAGLVASVMPAAPVGEVIREAATVPYAVSVRRPTDSWVPQLRNPEDLYAAYSGAVETLTNVSRQAALADLAHLPVVPGLTRRAFEACVGALLLQQPIIQQVDAFVATPQRFGAVRELLSDLPCRAEPGFEASYAWQTLMRWLLYFLPGRYELSVPHHSEIFGRVPSRPRQ